MGFITIKPRQTTIWENHFGELFPSILSKSKIIAWHLHLPFAKKD